MRLLLLLDPGLLLLGLALLLDGLGLHLLRLGLVDGFHQDALVLELVALGADVEAVVQVLVDLLGLAVLAEQAAKHALPAHPEDLLGHARLAGAPALADARVAPLPLRLKVLAHASARMDLHGFPNDETIADELPDVEPRVRHGYLARLIRVKPDAAGSTFFDRGRE